MLQCSSFPQCTSGAGFPALSSVLALKVSCTEDRCVFSKSEAATSRHKTDSWMEHDVRLELSAVLPLSDLLRTRELLGAVLRALVAAASRPFWPSLFRRFPTALADGVEEDGENQEREEICCLFVCCRSSYAEKKRRETNIGIKAL